MGKNDDIERLFREKFEGYRLRPSEGLWGRVVRQLRLREFLRFSPGQFNVWYLAGMLAVALTAYLVLHRPGSMPEENTPAPVTVMQPQEDHPAVAQEKKRPASGEERSAAVERKDESPVRKEASSRGKNEENVSAPGTVASEEGKVPPASEKGHEKEEGAAALTTGRKSGDRGKKTSERLLQKEQPAPVARFEMSVKKGCPPLKVQFVNRSQHASAYSWSLEPAGITFAAENPEYLFEVPGTYIVRLTAQDGEGRISVYTDTVEVFVKPRARFDYSPKDAVVPDEAIYFFNNSLDGERCLWSFGDGNTSTESDPVHKYTTDGPFDVKLTVWSAGGCADSMVMKQVFAGNGYYIRFPNAFIANPNGPTGGYFSEGSLSNDVFHPVWEGVADYHLQIFNRRGELVFESRELTRGWDGYILDQLATPGVYIWKARGTFSNGKPFVRFGNVTLIRKK